ncbi:putative peptidyl-prolyl cis-trans isomerase [Desulfuromonas soudanensis]|uniref:Putative peptidyl-prolyl cis-trans isomerase n=1 Tax=Desulfuromonas soudanensis TaxID=1603606 RepID=A0A0M4D3Y0_9BACT|nr:SseB family protein [Desulfuromonas soudanensis]ALC17276.1 putative peptidyl-prolyl cis-trans isomerase [Desulfuromonas soudanensis]
MTELDQALDKFIRDDKEQAQYYDLILNTNFYIPTLEDETAAGKTTVIENDTINPIVLEAEGKSYLMLFDSEERLSAWAKSAVAYVVLPGHAIAAMTPPDLHWAVNVGTSFSKEFVPEEIGWLKEIVEKHNAEEDEQK